MKNKRIAILAAAKGYNIEQVEPWVESLKQTSFAGKIFVIVYDDNVSLKNYLASKGITVVEGIDRGLTNIATQRFLDYTQLLESEHCKEVDLAIHTDIRDVVFQTDPGKWLNENIGEARIIATGEGVTYRHEDWNGDGLQQQFGKEMFDQLVDQETICSGIIAGEKQALANLFQTIHELAFFSGDPGGFIDQHFHNIAIRKVFSNITWVVPADEDWVCNCGTLIAIPMNSPDWSSSPRTPYNSFERFRKGTYVENMLVDLPVMKDSQVCTPSGKPYAIVHQYDRYQPWKNVLLEKYVALKLVS
jgi:hypothetical protein